MKFYKIRAFILIHISRILSAILNVELPPVVSVTALIKKNQELLFIDLSYLNGIGLPGGLVKVNEDIGNALKREIKEETGFDVINSKYLFSIPSSFRDIPTISIVFEVEVSGELNSSNEGKPFWSSPTNEVIEKLAYDGAKVVVRKYLNI